MEPLIDAIQRDLLDPKTLIGALVWGVVFIGIAAVLAAGVRKFAQRVESHTCRTLLDFDLPAHLPRWWYTWWRLSCIAISSLSCAHLEQHFSRASASLLWFLVLLPRIRWAIWSQEYRWCFTAHPNRRQPAAEYSKGANDCDGGGDLSRLYGSS